MKRKDAIDIIVNTSGKCDLIVATTGLISRELFERYDSARNFYVPGSMGLVSSIACGLALAHPARRVIAIDGDASLLMNLGSLVTIGHQKPENLTHIVLDNSSYGSCSEETSMSPTIQLSTVARSAGYNFVRTVSRPRELKRAILNSTTGLSFIRCNIALGGRRDFLRPLRLVTIKRRFMRHLESPKEHSHDVQR